ncbi:MAG TPA: LanC-like protein [Kofleriaceae bacterium]
MLWDPDRHEPLSADWDAQTAREGIREIVADAEAAFTGLWPQHPLDDPNDEKWTTMYCGAAGVAHALTRLGSTRDWAGEARRFLDVYIASPETGARVPSLMVGEVGIRAVANLDHYDLIAANIENPALEWLWGAPGTMLPALTMFERSGERRWRDLYDRNAEHLAKTFAYAEGVWMWTQSLCDEDVRLLGAAHGFAGNMYALLRGGADRTIIDRAIQTLQATAIRDGDLVNWAPQVGKPRKGREKMLVQWCHGAPGMITSLVRLPREPELDALFLGAAELVWRAGPVAKGPGLCHGTAGNGYALLAMAERTGDSLWLERARRFAIHALGQVRGARTEYGVGRYSLWTGDVGVALFVQDCLAGRGELPQL